MVNDSVENSLTEFYGDMLTNETFDLLNSKNFAYYNTTTKNYDDIRELSSEDYCYKIMKQLLIREIDISTAEFLKEINRYFEKNQLSEYRLMNVVNHFLSLYKS